MIDVDIVGLLLLRDPSPVDPSIWDCELMDG